MSTLVIVESPTKARTIRNYLPSDYRVEVPSAQIGLTSVFGMGTGVPQSL